MELLVTGMNCDGCANSVRKAIQWVYPTAMVDVELSTGRVFVRTDDQPGLGVIERARVARAVEQAGFGVEQAGFGVEQA